MIAAKLSNVALLAAVAAMISACGGGGSSDTPESAAPAAPVIASQPVAATVLTDGTATFTVAASGTGLSYQWKKNGTEIPGATSASYTTPAASFSDSGAKYSVAVSNAGGSVDSSAAPLTLMLSANQQAFEELILAPNGRSYQLIWNLNFAGPQASGTNFAQSDFAVMAASPLTNGPQTSAQSAPQNLTSSLALGTPGATRVLKNGVILVVPSTATRSKSTYVGADVRIDTLAADNSTVAYSAIRSNYETVALTGAMSSTAPDFAHYHNSFFSNAAILNPAANWASGASYIKFTQTNLGDRYFAFDCQAATTGANVSPCVTGTTLGNALTTGISSTSDGTIYHLSDGSVSTVGGVQVWVANSPRPQSATLSATVSYRIYFELNGNVYTGQLVKDGSPLGGSFYVSNPGGLTVTDRLTFLPFHIRMNKAARDSLAGAMAI
ncbi:immunoglobulin domain-containing family protein [Ramlibacter alkalitolerans]|uniref:Ig-like domain-containing protein n=1 Tax=Ramlibacter alkalitolerans TaxID=2039631 RepID=A0ABS1JT80_9BURK|nr:immunoglobulin domain-containing protein [Ramlibacter alkalitolerans]MBL0427454.1 hypothetical protein [Ramlibacter alkalitolerans]